MPDVKKMVVVAVEGSIYGLYVKLHMAYVQVMYVYGPRMTYTWSV